MIVGFVSTATALASYWVMTLSPIEGAHVSVRGVQGLLVSQSPLMVGGFITGPLVAWFGNRWRNNRQWLGALATALAVCFEPLAHAAVGSAIRMPAVWMGEVAVGLLMVAFIVGETHWRTTT